ncbi:Putative uncharacterized protein yghX [Listeria monocytogenes N53-1]|nr:Putative uncharacterized protein yghX [Listeria monocytogenes N53-1]
MKRWKKITIIMSAIIVILVAILFIGNNYEMNETRVAIPTTGGKLSAVVTTPKHGKPKGIIVFVHGDGAQEATQNGGYKPLMERFAKQGYISVSWDKLGVGKSSGNWLNQSMDDRANEVNQVIEWMKVKYPDSTAKIGLWGASQAGWVIPKAMNANNEIAFQSLPPLLSTGCVKENTTLAGKRKLVKQRKKSSKHNEISSPTAPLFLITKPTKATIKMAVKKK